MARSSSTPAAKAAPEEPSVGSRVHVQQDDAAAAEEDEEVIGTVPSVAHGWFSVSLPGQAQPRKCRRHELRVVGGSSRVVTASMAAPAASEDEEEEEEEEAIIRLDGKPKPPPVSQLQRDAARLASVRLETGLPKPSYLRFDRLGGKGKGQAGQAGQAAIKKASLDPKATRALALPPAQALLAPLLPAAASKKTRKEEEERARQTQAHHKDKEAEQDAKMILMRNYIDPKRFYKNLDSLAPGFQIGTVIEGRMESGPQGRLSRKQRKRTFVEEILADRAVRKYSKRKFSEIQQAAQSGRKGWQRRQQRKHAPKWARG